MESVPNREKHTNGPKQHICREQQQMMNKSQNKEEKLNDHTQMWRQVSGSEFDPGLWVLQGSALGPGFSLCAPLFQSRHLASCYADNRPSARNQEWSRTEPYLSSILSLKWASFMAVCKDEVFICASLQVSVCQCSADGPTVSLHWLPLPSLVFGPWTLPPDPHCSRGTGIMEQTGPLNTFQTVWKPIFVLLKHMEIFVLSFYFTPFNDFTQMFAAPLYNVSLYSFDLHFNILSTLFLRPCKRLCWSFSCCTEWMCMIQD